MKPIPLNELFGGHETDPIPDPYSVYARLREESPVTAIRTTISSSYLLTRYDDVLWALKDDKVFSNRSNRNGIGLVMGPTIVQMDGREHLRHRNIVTPALAPRALKGDFPAQVREIADALIDDFAPRGQADLVQEFTFTFPLRVFCRILGLPVEDYATFHQWAIDLTHIGTDPAKGLTASGLIADYLRPFIEKRRADPQPDLISRLIHADVDGNRMSEEEVVSFLRLLVVAGAETTYHLIGSSLFGLMTHPDQLKAVLADRSKIQAVMDETLRWEAPVQIVTRETLEPVSLHGVEIPAEAEIVTAIGSANRDERHFSEPEKFDIEREPKDHVAFGFGKHYCAGSRLAYLEAETALNALLDRLPNLRLAADADCEVVGMAFRSPNRLPVLFD